MILVFYYVHSAWCDEHLTINSINRSFLKNNKGVEVSPAVALLAGGSATAAISPTI
jgi:hypothetical protein